MTKNVFCKKTLKKLLKVKSLNNIIKYVFLILKIKFLAKFYQLVVFKISIKLLIQIQENYYKIRILVLIVKLNLNKAKKFQILPFHKIFLIQCKKNIFNKFKMNQNNILNNHVKNIKNKFKKVKKNQNNNAIVNLEQIKSQNG